MEGGARKASRGAKRGKGAKDGEAYHHSIAAKLQHGPQTPGEEWKAAKGRVEVNVD